jgi:parvulin-like peptidyl-prolyl isomerase
MVNLFRRFQQPLLIILTVFVIVAFVVLYGGPGTRLDRLGSDKVATIYDRNVQPAEYGSLGRQFEICRMMGMFDLMIPLAQNARTMADAADNYIWNTLVLRHEALRLGIQPTEIQVTEAIQRLPVFQTNGQYDHSRYMQAIQMAFAPRGLNASHLEELVRDSIRMQTVRDILSAGYAPAPDELEKAYASQFQKVEAAVIRISRDEISKTVAVSDDEIKAAYEARKDALKTPEKRKVQYVLFPLPKKDKDSAAPVAADLQKVADRADDFASALLAEGAKFNDVAKRFEIEVKTTGSFAAGERLAELGNQPRATVAAFALTAERPFSDTIQTEQGYLILNLLETVPAKPLSLEESKAQLVDSLKADKVRETLSLKAGEARKKVEEAVKGGKTFVQAAEAAGFKAETLEPFSRSESKLTGDDASLIQNGASDLKAGQTSAPLDGPNGSVIVHVLKRQDIDPADLEKQKASLIPMLETQRVDGLLSEWIDRQRAAAGLQLAQVR